jgi:hypothetical protein
MLILRLDGCLRLGVPLYRQMILLVVNLVATTRLVL